MAQTPCKRTRLATSSGLGLCKDMDVTTENGSVEVQGPEGNAQSNSGNGRCLVESELFEDLLRDSIAFIDKTLFINDFFYNEDEGARKMLITAPNGFGKSVNMNTLKVFAEAQVDESGNIVTCVTKNAAGKWEVDKNKTPPNNYKLFRNDNKPLKIYNCYCSTTTKHTGDDLENGTCESRQFFYQHCGQHPVAFMSLKNISCNNMKEFLDGWKESLCEMYKQHMYLGDERSRLSEEEKIDFNLFCQGKKSEMIVKGEFIVDLEDIDLVYALNKLVEYLHIQFGKKVLVLIDELDTPLMKLLHDDASSSGLGSIADIVKCIGTMVRSVVKGNDQVFGALINGCCLLATTICISLYANNISVCPFLEDYGFSRYYGFTTAEIANLLRTSPFEGFDETDILSYYNGYRVFDTDIKIYNPYSVLAYLDAWKSKWGPEKEHRPIRHWSRNHGISSLDKLFAIEGVRRKLDQVITQGSIAISNPVLRMTSRHILILKEVMLKPDEVDDKHADLFLQYMKDRGYFNIIHKYSIDHVYALPDGEIRDEIMHQFYDASYYKTKYNIADVAVDKYATAISDLDRQDNESFQELSDSIASLVSGDMKPKSHQAEIKGVLYTFAKCSKNFENVYFEPLCQNNKKCRCDLLIIRKDGTGIIIEVKWSKDTAQAGLQQIFDNEYYKAFEPYNITKGKIYIGLHINDEKVSICAFATSKDKVVEKSINITQEELIVKFSTLL